MILSLGAFEKVKLCEARHLFKKTVTRQPDVLESCFGAFDHFEAVHLERIHEDAEVRRPDLIQLEQIASAYPSRERFLTELTLDPPEATSDQVGVPLLDEDYLILSTIHSAKGQEWKSVFVLNVVDGCIPSDLGTGTTEEIEKERRLLYVAMTRAKDDLDLVIPQRFFVHGQSVQGDRHLYASRTRFIPEVLLPLFDRSSWPLAGSCTTCCEPRASDRCCPANA